MRALLVPIVAVGLMAGGVVEGPQPDQMRAAYQSALELQVQNALDFVAESNGAEALAKLRAAGSDRFAIRDFQKLDCSRGEVASGYHCTFRIVVAVNERIFERTLTGRFVTGRSGLTFVEEI